MRCLAITILALLLVATAHAQGPIYRCGNEYVNTVPEDQKAHCKLVEGGKTTIVQKLGADAQERFDACLNAAAKNPTGEGVALAAAICRRRFGQ